MRKLSFFFAFALSFLAVYADKDIKFYMNTGEIKCVAMERVSKVLFDEVADKVAINIDDGTEYISLSLLDSIKYGVLPSFVDVKYSDAAVVVENPFAFDSVAVGITGAKVTVNSSTSREVIYNLRGESSDGAFKIYSNKKYVLNLAGINLTNKTGAAINSQCKKQGKIVLADATVNSLADGSAYASLSKEDEKGTLFSEGQLCFEGTGVLNVSSLYKHAVCSDDYIAFNGGSINVIGAAGDAVHVNDSLIISGGMLNLVADGDGIDCDGVVNISGGSVKITLAGDASNVGVTAFCKGFFGERDKW